MRRGVILLIAGVAALAGLYLSPVHAANRYPVSVGVSYGSWTPSLDAFNLRWVDESTPISTTIGGVTTTGYVRRPLEVDTTLYGHTLGPQPYLFSSSSGIGINAKLRLHNDMFVVVEYDSWKQSVGSFRKFAPAFEGYEANEVKLNPITFSLLYYVPTEAGMWWPHLYIGAGGGTVMVERSNTQLTNDGIMQTSTASGSGPLFTGMAGLEYTIPFLQDRLALFAQGRYIMGSYSEQFTVLGSTGISQKDPITGRDLKEDVSVSVQGPQVKFGVTMSFGQIAQRATKGVLTGFIESSRRRGGYAMAPSYGGASSGGGFAMIYPQSAEQVQVVEGTGQIDEDRIRQVIREELIGARLGTSAARPVDDLAEQQLRGIRERRLQAEQELQQLKDLLREEG